MCSATTRAGRSCNAPPRLGRDLCIFHDPDFAAAHRASSARGGRHRPPPPPDYQTLIVNIDDRASLQAVIESVLRLQLYGQIPLRRSGHILRTLALAARNFDPPNFVPQEGYRQVLHTRSYIGARETIHAALPQIADALKLDEASDRAASIEDARARRYEVRQVDELFGSTQPRKAAG